MVGLIEAASAILSSAERRLEVIAQNAANVATPGYRRLISFETMIGKRDGGHEIPRLQSVQDNRAGQLVRTDNPLDLALAGEGVFIVRSDRQLHPTRGGSFSQDSEGRLVDQHGRFLQQSGGGDLVSDAPISNIGRDGVVLANGQPVGRVGVFIAQTGVAVDSWDEVVDPDVRQGMVEQSNVTLGDEMVSIMAVSRSSETGARLVQVYDDLIGRVFSSLGQAGR